MFFSLHNVYKYKIIFILPCQNCTSPILASPTETEKHQMVQNYVDSIIPNRVYYEKTPTKEIISKLPRHTTFETMDDPSVKITMERQKEMPQKIVERIDYKDNENDETKPNDSNYNKEETHETVSCRSIIEQNLVLVKKIFYNK